MAHPVRLAVVVALVLPAASFGQSGTWVTNTAGAYNWSDAANWQNGVIADGAGNTANFTTAGRAGPVAVNLDSPRTLGNLVFDNSTNSYGWTIAGNPLALSSPAFGGPTIAVNNTTFTATITASLDAPTGWTKTGPGTLALAGPTGGHDDAGISVAAGTLAVNGAAIAGFKGVSTQNGGKFQAGNSPGRAIFGNLVLGPGGVQNFNWQINNATGTAGPPPDANNQVSGWGLLDVSYFDPFVPVYDNFSWTASNQPGERFNISLQTLINPITVGQNTQGSMANFDPAQKYSWKFTDWLGQYTGPTDDASLTATAIFDLTNFVNPHAGTFTLHFNGAGKEIDLVYTPVPEPSSLVLLAAAGSTAAVVARRRGNRARVS